MGKQNNQGSNPHPSQPTPGTKGIEIPQRPVNPSPPPSNPVKK